MFILIWLPQAIHQVLNWTYWWQVKEYRFDRFWLFLGTKEGRRKLDLNFIIIKLVFIFFANFAFVFVYLTIALLSLKDFVFLKDLFWKKVRKPELTLRAKEILATNLMVLLIVILYVLAAETISQVLKSFIFGEFALLVASYIGILWTIPLVNRTKAEEIKKAKMVLAEVKPTVIGVTGSYGKTTTKDFIAYLLSQKYKVAKTEGSENTEFGIARKTYKNVSPSIKFFVVEMGAYKRGEITKLADIVKPSIGIITGIEPQHLSLFGKIGNIMKAKFELVESLPENGVAIFNLSNKFCRKLAKTAKKSKVNLKVLGYYVKDKVDKAYDGADIVAEVSDVNYEKVSFRLQYKNETKKFSVRLPGVHFVENLACAILVAKLFGLTWSEIEKACQNVAVPQSTMNVYKLKSGSVIIDDTHNSTPLAFESAVKYLSYFRKRKKYVVTSGIIELGDMSDLIHRKLGRLMSKTVDKIFLTNPDFYPSIKAGLEKKDKKLVLVGEDSALEMYNIIESGGAVILLEGRLPVKIAQVFRSYFKSQLLKHDRV